jgi:hypothetical protein
LDFLIVLFTFYAIFSGFFVSFDVAPQLDAPFNQCPPLQAYVTALQKQRLRSSIPYIVTYIMRPVVFTSSWGLEGLGLIVVQVGGAASLFSLPVAEAATRRRTAQRFAT